MDNEDDEDEDDEDFELDDDDFIGEADEGEGGSHPSRLFTCSRVY